MKIKYKHIYDPETEKIHDTEKTRKNTFHNTKPQKWVDDFELKQFERDKKRGIIIYYEILNDE